MAGQINVISDWLSCVEPESNQRQDNRSVGQVGTCQVQTSQHHPGQDLETVRHWPRWNAWRRWIRSRYAPCEPETWGTRTARRLTNTSCTTQQTGRQRYLGQLGRVSSETGSCWCQTDIHSLTTALQICVLMYFLLWLPNFWWNYQIFLLSHSTLSVSYTHLTLPTNREV